MKKLCAFLFILCMAAFAVAADSLLVEGKVLLDGTGRSNVSIAGYKTDADGGFSFRIPTGRGALLTPVYKHFLFDPPAYAIAAADTAVDSIFFTANRQVKKTIIISGQSNAEHCGDPKYFVDGEQLVDNDIPYYLAYSGGVYGLSTLGLLTKFGKSYSYCKNYNCGFGFEMLLARTLYKHYSDDLAVMKMSYSGTALYDEWQPNGNTWLWFIDKHDQAVTRYRNEGYEPEYIGIFWLQGESDETADAAPLYASNLHDLIDRMRARFPNSSDVDELPFILARIKWNPSSPYEEPVREAQMDVVNHRSFTACVDIDDCHPFRYSSTNMHFGGGALNRIGYKFAAQYLDLLGTPIDSSVTISVGIDEMVDTTVVLTVEGDTNFTHIMDTLTYDFPAKLGDSLYMFLNLDSDTFSYKPAARTIIFAYDQSVLKSPVNSFNVTQVVAIEDYPEDMDHVLMNCYPNPFNPSTAISFDLPEYGDVSLSIYDLQGKKIATLVEMPMSKGSYQVNWNASAYASGVYIAKLTVGSDRVIQKLTLLK